MNTKVHCKASYIPDTIVNLEEKDSLGTKSYADAIYMIITEGTGLEPLNIGLFGGWGTGKSSIVDTVRKKIAKTDNVGVMYYDAWKYSKDAFRRSFILELKREFGLDETEELSSFYCDKTEDVDHKIALKKNWWLNIVLILFPLLLGTAYILAQVINQDLTFSEGIYTTLLSAYAVILSYLVKESMIEYKISITKAKTFAPEQFEEAFKNAIYALRGKELPIGKWFLQKLKGEKTYEKIVLIIDNIDRCHAELSKELLLTVKNFMEIDGCIFLVPVDETALKEQLGYENHEGEEFLRKFFNISIRIKKFTVKNLREYTKGLIQESKLSFSEKIADIIAQEFSKNPRRIKQFLNNLYAESEIAKAQENNGFIDQGAISNNIEFLAKVQIIREEWPALYSLCNEYPRIFLEIDNSIRENSFVKDLNSNIYSAKNIAGMGKIELTREQYLFLKRNLNITSNNVEPYLRLRDFEHGVSSDLALYILTADWQNIQSLITEGNVSTEQALEFLLKEYDLAVNKSSGLYETTGYNLIALFLEITRLESFREIFTKFHYRFRSVLDDSRIVDILPNLNFRYALDYSGKLCDVGEHYLRNSIVQYMIKYSISDQELFQYIDLFCDNAEVLEDIRPCISNAIASNLIDFKELAEYLEDDSLANSIIDSNITDELMKKFENSISEANKLVVSILGTLNHKGLLNDYQRDEFVQKVTPYLNSTDGKALSFWLSSMSGFITKQNAITGALGSTINTIYSNSYNLLNANPTNKDIIECNIWLIEVMKEYYIKVDKKADSKILGYIITYLNRSEENVIMGANKAFYEIIDGFGGFDWGFIDTIISRVDSITNEELLLELVKTLLLHVSKYSIEDNKPNITKAKLDTIIDLIFNKYFEDKGQYKEILLKLIGIITLKDIVGLKIKTISEKQQQKLLLEVADEIKDKSVIDTLINNLIESIDNYNEGRATIQFIKEKAANSNSLKYPLLQQVAKLDQDLEKYYVILSICIDNDKLFSKEDFILLLQYIRVLLTSDATEYKTKGIKVLVAITNIAYKSRYKEVLELVNEYKSEIDDYMHNKDESVNS